MESSDLIESLKPVDPSRFVRIDRYADPQVQAFEVHTPVHLDGSPDETRPVRVYTSIVINRGGEQYTQLFEINCDSMQEAVSNYRGQAAEVGAKILDALESQEFARKMLLDGAGVSQ